MMQLNTLTSSTVANLHNLFLQRCHVELILKADDHFKAAGEGDHTDSEPVNSKFKVFNHICDVTLKTKQLKKIRITLSYLHGQLQLDLNQQY